MKKVKVKILEPIAGLADPKPTSVLDEKYKSKIAAMNKGRRVAYSKEFTDELIAQMKSHDRYGEKQLGFPRDFAFKAGDEVMINAELAQKWEEGGICMIVAADEKKAA